METILLSNQIRKHFQNHYKQETLPKITLPWGSFKRINVDQAVELDLVPTDEEILLAIKSCDPSKAPDMMALT